MLRVMRSSPSRCASLSQCRYTRAAAVLCNLADGQGPQESHWPSGSIEHLRSDLIDEEPAFHQRLSYTADQCPPKVECPKALQRCVSRQASPEPAPCSWEQRGGRYGGEEAPPSEQSSMCVPWTSRPLTHAPECRLQRPRESPTLRGGHQILVSCSLFTGGSASRL